MWTDIILDFDAAEGDRIDLGSQAYTIVIGEDGSASLKLSGGGTIYLADISVSEVQEGWLI